MLRRSSVGGVVLRDNLPAAFFSQLQGGFGFGLCIEQVGGLISALHRAARSGELERRTVTIEGYIFGGLHIFLFVFRRLNRLRWLEYTQAAWVLQHKSSTIFWREIANEIRLCNSYSTT